MDPLYEIRHRKLGKSISVYAVCKRGDIETPSAEKIIPLIFEYDKAGRYRTVSAGEVLRGLKQHPYKAKSRDFNQERLASLEVSGLYKHLEAFPTLNTLLENGERKPHPVAEMIYASTVFLRPDEELATISRQVGYLQRTKLLPIILDRVVKTIKADLGLNLDLFSVPKENAGAICYVADEEGYALPAKVLSFGFHKAIPSDRLARELSSMKAAEKFVTPAPLPFELPENIRPFVSMLRVGVIATNVSMLDAGDLYPSGVPKIACKLERQFYINDLKSKPKGVPILIRARSAAIEVVGVETRIVDETTQMPATVRLVFPNGVKLAAQPKDDDQPYDLQGKPIDLLIDFGTLQKKGALALFAMEGPESYAKGMTREDCVKVFKEKCNRDLDMIRLGSTFYEGFILDLPVMRPGQRYTELSKGMDSVPIDLISRAILNQPYIVPPALESEYATLKGLRTAIMKEIKQHA